MKRIGIIGLGHMGQAMIHGFKMKRPETVLIGYDYRQDRTEELAKKLAIEVVSDYQSVVQKSDYLIIAVRPPNIDEVAKELDRGDLQDKIVISIVSGLNIAKLKAKFKQPVAVVRALPNLNAQVGLSATGVAFDSALTLEQRQEVLEQLQGFGQTYEIDEDNFSAFTVIAGCTPAYFFKIVDAIYKAALKAGMETTMALDAVIQAGYGSLTTLVNSTAKPKELVDAVCVPGGVTIVGINHLDEEGFDDLVEMAIAKSIERDLKEE